jgi:hypothetical protein
MQMFHKILPETRKLTMNKYGSRVVQTAFSYVTQEQHTEWTKVNTLKKEGQSHERSVKTCRPYKVIVLQDIMS